MPFLEMTEAFGSASVDRKGAEGCLSLIVSVWASVATAVSITL